MMIIHKESGKVLAKEMKVAQSFSERLIGLMFINEMKGFDGLLIKNTNSIHNCFVRFPIDAVFVNKDFKVVKVLKNFKPWRFSSIYFRAKHVLELPAGVAGDFVKEGDTLEAQGV